MIYIVLDYRFGFKFGDSFLYDNAYRLYDFLLQLDSKLNSLKELEENNYVVIYFEKPFKLSSIELVKDVHRVITSNWLMGDDITSILVKLETRIRPHNIWPSD